MLAIRKAITEYGKDFAELMLESAPFFPILFGNKIKTVLQDLFHCRFNHFSFEHVYFAEVDGEKAGMILGYDCRVVKREILGTGFLLLKNSVSILVKIIKFNTTFGKVGDGEYYISNIATYPRYRGRGVGKGLMLKTEQEAKRIGA